VLADLAAWNAPPEVIAAARKARARADEVEVYPDNWASVMVFQRLHTQWRTRGMDGEISGLDYSSFPITARMLKVPRKDWEQVFDDVGLMENETLAVVAERRSK